MTARTNSLFDYSNFIQFYETYKSKVFQNINPDDSTIVRLEKELSYTNQFFFIADLMQLKVLYYSGGNYEFFGVKPEEMGPDVVYAAIHPDDKKRFSNARAKLIKLGMDVFNNQQDKMCLSSNFRIKNSAGKYVDLLFQEYICLSETPRKTAYSIQVHTNVTSMIKIPFGYHYYVGPDLSYFRYPDKDLLNTGNIFTKRQWEIIMLITKGLESDQIAEKLFLSTHTVNRHRQNILKKTGNKNTHDLVVELHERGLL